MAQHYRPGRSLFIFLASIAGLLVWAFWPGANHAPKLGLDLRGGTQVILSPQVAAGETLSQDQLNQTVAIIRQRVDGFDRHHRAFEGRHAIEGQRDDQDFQNWVTA